MTISPPAPGEPRRPDGPRNPGDAWVVAPTGEKYWGRFGAAGLLAVDPERGVLLQHRVAWSHFGGTWGLPGGALHEDETAIVGALREAQEEAGVPDGATRARFTSVLDLGIWSYTTVVADVLVPFEPVISDPESVALEWVPIDEVDARPLHPGFGSAWPTLRRLLSVRPALVVDAANVVGSVPDGWWKDRAGATARLRAQLADLAVPAADLGVAGADLGVPSADFDVPRAVVGVPAADFGAEGTLWFPEIALVVEGQARALPDDDGADAGIGVNDGVDAGVDAGVGADDHADADDHAGVAGSGGSGTAPAGSEVSVVRASAAGDDAIIDEAARRVAAGQQVSVVTSDRELRSRAEGVGARTASVRWLRELLRS